MFAVKEWKGQRKKNKDPMKILHIYAVHLSEQYYARKGVALRAAVSGGESRDAGGDG